MEKVEELSRIFGDMNRMHLKSFPFSMENMPRQKSFACLSLKLGCVVAALLVILHSVLSLALCTASLAELEKHLSADNFSSMLGFAVMITVTIVYAITLLLTAVMLVGTLREKPKLISPWVVWTSVQLVINLLLFIFWTTTNVINHSGGNSILSYAVEFLILLLRFYMLMIVASYYKQLDDEQYDGERLKTLAGKEAWYSSA